MKVEITVPKLGATMTSAFVSEWHVSVGDEVKKDDAVVTVETDKIQNTVTSPVDGVVTEILVENDEERNIGEVLCIVEG